MNRVPWFSQRDAWNRVLVSCVIPIISGAKGTRLFPLCPLLGMVRQSVSVRVVSERGERLYALYGCRVASSSIERVSYVFAFGLFGWRIAIVEEFPYLRMKPRRRRQDLAAPSKKSINDRS